MGTASTVDLSLSEIEGLDIGDQKNKETNAMNKIHVLGLFIAVLLAGCASVPTQDIKVKAVADPKAQFSGYKSYAWLGAAAIVNDAFGRWEPPGFDADAEIKFLIDRELRTIGMSQNSIDPDLIVAFAAGINMDALGLKMDPKTKKESLVNVPRGGLMIALVDNDTRFVIWMGVATGELQKELDASTVRARLDYAVTEIFRKLPQ
jgi:hypothetical protein